MAASVVVQFRVPKDLVREVRDSGGNPNEIAKRQFENYVRTLRMRRAAERLRRYPAKRPFDPVRTVRELREEHDR